LDIECPNIRTFDVQPLLIYGIFFVMRKLLWGILIGVALVFAGNYFLLPYFDTIVVDDVLPSRIKQSADPGTIEHLSDAQKRDMTMQIIEANKTDISMSEEMPREQVTVSEAYRIKDTPLHPASGEVRIVESDGQPIVRFENFKTINGPNVHVYLAKDLDAKEFIDLGRLRGTEGNINYTIPSSVDISEYKYVMHWCVPFGVLFNYAEIR